MPPDDEDRRERRREQNRQDRRDARGVDPAPTSNPNAPLKYDLEAIERNRNWVGEELWKASAGGRLNLKDRNQVAQFLGSLRPPWFPAGDHGIVNEKEKGRHMRSLFLGDLGAEGWGMGNEGYSRGIEEYRPNWSRMISGMQKGADGLYGSDGGKWYDAFGRLVRTDPVATATAATPAPAPVAAPTETTTPAPNPTFYGGSTAPNPYGTAAPVTGGSTNPAQPKKPNTSSAPGWYSTWRF